jgi:isoleucyl-tRNA synthetase
MGGVVIGDEHRSKVDGFMPIMNQQKQLVQSVCSQENLSNWYVRLCRRRFWKNMRRTKSGLPNFIYVFVNHK